MFNEDYDFESKKNQWIGAIVLGLIGVVLTAVIVVAIVFFTTYNNMVDAREDVNLAEANVETQMQSRLELIPDLVEVVKFHANHKEKVFAEIANAEANLTACMGTGDTAMISDANNELSKQINNLIVLARDYPDLTDSKEYVSLMDQIEGSVRRIAVARETYNGEVSDYNRMIAKAPMCFVANMFGFEKKEEFVADKEAEKTSMVHMMDDETENSEED